MPYQHHPAMAGALLAAVAIAAALRPAPAEAQIRRCTTPDGGTVYTDRSCSELGAVENRPQAGAGESPALRWRGGCSRRLQDLVFEVTAAIDARDTNRLARSYDFSGMGHASGYAMIERLDAIAQRPLVNISALRPAAPAPVPAPVPAPWTGGGQAVAPLAAPAGGTAAAATPAPSRRPVALRIDQVLSDGITPATTTFGLRRRMDCWWIAL